MGVSGGWGRGERVLAAESRRSYTASRGGDAVHPAVRIAPAGTGPQRASSRLGAPRPAGGRGGQVQGGGGAQLGERDGIMTIPSWADFRRGEAGLRAGSRRDDPGEVAGVDMDVCRPARLG